MPLSFYIYIFRVEIQSEHYLNKRRQKSALQLDFSSFHISSHLALKNNDDTKGRKKKILIQDSKSSNFSICNIHTHGKIAVNGPGFKTGISLFSQKNPATHYFLLKFSLASTIVSIVPKCR